MRPGFSLVELSIVLVIIGLLTSGILVGQNLIHAAELRAVTQEHGRHVAAIQTFRNKYQGLPGDLREATRFWGRLSTAADCVTNSGTAVGGTGTCDGNGDGRIDAAAAASQSGEMFQAWRQLAAAGLTEGSYTGIAGSTSATHSTLAVNTPASRLSNAGWGIMFLGQHLGNSISFALDYGSVLGFGSVHGHSSGAVYWPYGPLIAADDAWNIDTKLDDGKPASGRVIATGIFTPLSTRDPCFLTLSGTPGPTNYDTAYNVGSSISACGFLFRNAY